MTAADLPSLRAGLDALRRDADALFGALSPAQLGWRPAPGAWSIGEVAAHLRATEEAYLPALDRALARARARGRAAALPHRPTWVGRMAVRAMTSPRKMPTPPAFRPRAPQGVTADWGVEVEGYRNALAALRSRVEAAAGLDLNAGPVVSPALFLIRMNLGDAFLLSLAHGRRHLGQMQRIRAAEGFPAV